MIVAGAHASPAQLARFRREAEAVARLHHPHIIKIHDVGDHGGLPFFALEYAEGGSLARSLTGSPLPVVRAASLVETLARAVQHAHQQGIVHRDLTPGNVLLMADGTPKIADFGLAKFILGGPPATESGAVLGTPAYMAPEQASGRTREIGPATDVYALGAIFYHLLTGRPPFTAETSLDTMMQVLADEPIPPRRLQAKVPRDLETVCLKCLRKEAGKRYATAQALADDLRRFLDGRPVQARPAGLCERGLKWARRRPTVAALVAVSALAVIGGLAAIGALWRNAEARAGAVLQLAAAQKELDDRQGRLTALEREMHDAERATRRALYIRDMQLAQTAEEQEQSQRVLTLLGRFLPRDGQPDVRDFEWRYLWGLYHRERARLRGHTSPVKWAEFAPGGGELVTLASEGGMRLWDPAGGKELAPATAEADGVVGATYAAGGRLLVAGCTDGKVCAWNRPGAGGLGAPRWTFPAHAKAVVAVTVSPDGRTLATGGEDGVAALWNWEGAAADAPPTLNRRLAGHTAAVFHVVFSPDGNTLATVSGDQTGRLWDVATGRLLRTFVGESGAWVTRVVFSPKGDLMAVAEAHPFQPLATNSVRLLDTSTFRPRSSFPVKGGGWGVAFSPDGALFAYASNWGVVRVWHLPSARTTDVIHAHADRTGLVAFSPDGRTLVTGANDGLAKLWDVAPRPEPWLQAHPGGVDAVAFSPDGRRLASAGIDGLVRVWDPDARALLADLPGRFGRAKAVAFSPDGRWLVSASEDKTVRLWDTTAKAQRAVFRGHTDLVNSVAFSPDGGTIASGLKDGTVRLWDMPGAGEREVTSPRQTLTHPQDQVTGVAFSPDGATLAMACWFGGVTLYDPASGAVRTNLSAKELTGVAFSPDGRQVAAGTWAGTVEVWDVASGKPVLTLLADASPVLAVAYSPDGQTLFSTSRDEGAVKLWDVATGLERFTLKGHTSAVRGLALTRDGRLLATASTDGSVRLWPAPADTGAPERI